MRKNGSEAAARQEPGGAENQREVLRVFGKNASERVEASLTSYHGHDLIDVRVFYKSGDEIWRPSRKGICLSVDLFDELEATVAAIRAALEQRGVAA